MAYNRYALTFTFNDGSAQSVEFEVPPGEPGYTPKKGVDYFDGAKGDTGDKGDKGDKGEPGHTPVRGVDYWTEDDKAIIMSEIAKSEDAPAIICEKRGSVVSANDASDRLLKGLTLYGKTTQAGTPTPEDPLDLVSAGASGAINTTVAGKNLVDVFTEEMSFGRNGVAATSNRNIVDANGKITINVPGSATYGLGFAKDLPANKPVTISYNINSIGNGRALTFIVYDMNDYATSVTSRQASKTGEFSHTFTPPKSSKYMLGWYVSNGTAPCGAEIEKLQLEFGESATAYERGKIFQTLTASTPNGLPGIPVSSGGNYTDESGQQWICDEIDFGRGVRVQKLYRTTFNGSDDEKWVTDGSTFYILAEDMPCPHKPNSTGIICSHFSTDTTKVHIRLGNAYGVMVRNTGFASLAEWNAWLAENPITVLYERATPIETPLSTKEMTDYNALHTNKPTTTIYNDAGAGLAVEYVADTKNYIDNKFTELQNAILSAGANI